MEIREKKNWWERNRKNKSGDNKWIRGCDGRMSGKDYKDRIGPKYTSEYMFIEREELKQWRTNKEDKIKVWLLFLLLE